MKRIVSILLVITFVVSMFSQCLVYANSGETCSVNGSSHRYTSEISCEYDHPHKGYLKCDCGKKIYRDAMILESCDICRQILCDFGIHDYSTEFSFDEEAYGTCYCGEIAIINATWDEYTEHFSHTSGNYSLGGCPFCEVGFAFWEDYENFLLSYDFGDSQSDNRNEYEKEPNIEPTITHTGNSHDEYPSIHKLQSHPHKGFLECSCGKALYYDAYLSGDCEQCQAILCDANVHDYSSNIQYTEDGCWCMCSFCGDEIYFECSYDEYTRHLNHKPYFSPNCFICSIVPNYDMSIYEYQYEKLKNSEWQDLIDDDIYYNNNTSTESDTKTPSNTNSFTSHHCDKTGSEHEFTEGYVYSADHPHPGYYTCACGEKLYFNSKPDDNCNECFTMLCNEGIHDYSFRIEYDDSTKKSGFGLCRCGKTMNFEQAKALYSDIVPDDSDDKFIVPCAECTFKTIYYNRSAQWEVTSNQDLNVISTLYGANDVSYANTHYKDVLKYTYLRDCNHEGYYLEDRPIIVEPQVKPAPTPKPSQSQKPSQSPKPSQSKPSDKKQEEQEKQEDQNNSLDSYYLYDLQYYSSLPVAEVPTEDFYSKLDKAAKQTLLGSYAEDVTLGGTIGEVFFSLTGFDVYKDFTDLYYEFTHWQNSWGNYASTALNLVSLLPVVGVAKNADEIALLKKVDKLHANFFAKLCKLSKTDIYKLMTKSKCHGLTRHVGKVDLADLKKIRRNSADISSFFTQDDAIEAVQKALSNENNAKKIFAKLQSGDKGDFAIEQTLDKVVGVGLFGGSDTLTDATKVRVIISPISSTDFAIKTAFPIQ